jgi:hypothetical protein
MTQNRLPIWLIVFLIFIISITIFISSVYSIIISIPIAIGIILVFLKKKAAITWNVTMLWILPIVGSIITGILFFNKTAQEIWPGISYILLLIVSICCLLFKKYTMAQILFIIALIFATITYSIVHPPTDWDFDFSALLIGILSIITLFSSLWTQYFTRSKKIKEIFIN